MHPAELRNHALVAAMIAEIEGFISTAEALRQVALLCCIEADLMKKFKRALPDSALVQNSDDPPSARSLSLM